MPVKAAPRLQQQGMPRPAHAAPAFTARLLICRPVRRIDVPARQGSAPTAQKITVNKDFSLNVPDNPIIPYIEGDGTGFRTSRR